MGKYQLRGGFATAHPMLLPQPAKSYLLLRTLLLLKPLLLLTSQMATLGLRAQKWSRTPPRASGRGPRAPKGPNMRPRRGPRAPKGPKGP